MSSEASAPVPSAVRVERWDRTSRLFTGAIVGVLALLALVPMAFTSATSDKFTTLFILVILATMWNALAGFGGLVSVGQQAFIGIGAYATIYLADDQGINTYLAIVLAALFAGLISLPTSLLAFRLRGGQFAIGMWVIAEAFRLIVANWESIGGGTGRSLTTLNVYEPATRSAYTYWMALAMAALLLTLVAVMLRSRLGDSLQAIRDDEVAAASLGVRVTRAKRVVFLLTAVGCGAAGALLAAQTLRVQPNAIFGVQWTAFMIFMVLIGGLGTFEGPVIGALVFFLVQEQFSDQGSWYLIGLGVVAVLMTLLMPRGLWGTLVDRYGVRLVPVGYRLRGLPPGAGAGPAADAEASSVQDPAAAP